MEHTFPYARLKVVLTLLALGLSALNGDALARRAVPVETLAYPVLISLEGKPTGSGFYFNYRECVYLITAGHTLLTDGEEGGERESLIAKTIGLTSYRPDIDGGGTNELEVDLEALLRKGSVRPHQSQDVVAVYLGKGEKIKGHLETVFTEGVSVRSYKGLKMVYPYDIKRFKSVFPGNEVILFGYPSSLGVPDRPQIDITRPLLRKGIIAGKNREEQTIILDCASYRGNSGSPVLQFEGGGGRRTRFSVIALVKEFVPFYEASIDARTRHPLYQLRNSGYSVAVPMDTVLDLVTQ